MRSGLTASSPSPRTSPPTSASWSAATAGSACGGSTASSGSSPGTGRSWRNWPGRRGVRDYLGARVDATSFVVDDRFRGVLKQALIGVGYPAEDLGGYTEGTALKVELREVTRAGLPFHVRDYQTMAVEAFHAGGDVRGGSGVIVLPCGAGKTIVGLSALAALKKQTLVLTTSTTAVEQWRREILDKTDLDEAMVALYTGDSKAIAPVTLATYQIVTYRPQKDG